MKSSFCCARWIILLTFFHSLVCVHPYVKDTAGQERYRTITTAYYRGAMGFILMYDVTNEESFSSVHDWWVSVCRRRILYHMFSDYKKACLYEFCRIREGNQVLYLENKILDLRKRSSRFVIDNLIINTTFNGKEKRFSQL